MCTTSTLFHNQPQRGSSLQLKAHFHLSFGPRAPGDVGTKG